MRKKLLYLVVFCLTPISSILAKEDFNLGETMSDSLKQEAPSSFFVVFKILLPFLVGLIVLRILFKFFKKKIN